MTEQPHLLATPLLLPQSLRALKKPVLFYAATLVSFTSLATLTRPGDMTNWTGMCLIVTSLILAVLTTIATVKAIYYSPPIRRFSAFYLLGAFISLLVASLLVIPVLGNIGDIRLQLVISSLAITIFPGLAGALAIYAVLIFSLKTPGKPIESNQEENQDKEPLATDEATIDSIC